MVQIKKIKFNIKKDVFKCIVKGNRNHITIPIEHLHTKAFDVREEVMQQYMHNKIDILRIKLYKSKSNEYIIRRIKEIKLINRAYEISFTNPMELNIHFLRTIASTCNDDNGFNAESFGKKVKNLLDSNNDGLPVKNIGNKKEVISN